MDNPRIRCFFDVEIEAVPLGRVIFELFSDVCPKTCENFRALCTGEAGEGSTTNKPLHYKGVKFHRVIKDFMIQAGDFSAGNGTGGESIYGGHFEDENFELNHEAPFLLSMANRGKDTNGSQFFITTQPATHLDGKHVVFGRVLNGKEVIVAIEDLPVDNKSRPLQPAVISNCGELVLQRSAKSKAKDKKKKKKHESEKKLEEEKKKKKKKKEKEKLKSSDIKVEIKQEIKEEDLNGTSEMTLRLYKPHPLVSNSNIKPEEIPEVPKNKFLDREYETQQNMKFGKLRNFENRPIVQHSQQERQMGARLKSHNKATFYTRSGRKVKGRGSLRYRTPSRSRSRSVTPPHWKQAQKRTITLDIYERVSEKEREREIERRKRREERHRLTSESGRTEEERGRNWENQHSDKIERRSRKDKTEGDWRMARHQTSLSDDINSTQKPDVKPKDLRETLNRSEGFKEHGERKKPKLDDYELDDTALDYEAPSEEEEGEILKDSNLDTNDNHYDSQDREKNSHEKVSRRRSKDRKNSRHMDDQWERKRNTSRRSWKRREASPHNRRRHSRGSSRDRRHHSRDRHSRRDRSRDRSKRTRRTRSRSRSTERLRKRDRESKSPTSRRERDKDSSSKNVRKRSRSSSKGSNSSD